MVCGVAISAPFRTDEGLFLEDENLLIAWGTPLEISEVLPGNPEVLTLANRNWAWQWKDRSLFGGIRGTAITVRVPNPAASYPMFPMGLPTFHRFHIFARIEPDERQNNIDALSLPELQRLVRNDIERVRLLQRSIYDSLAAVPGAPSYSGRGSALDRPKSRGRENCFVITAIRPMLEGWF